MKVLSRLVLPGFFFMATSVAFASGDTPASGSGTDTTDLTTYLLNLGQYLGYDLTTSPSGSGSGSTSTEVNHSLLNISATQLVQNYLFNTVLGSLLVNTAGGTAQFVPSNSQAYAAINAFANYTFSSPSYASPSAQQVSVSSLIDQPTYQADPVSQAVLNILGTPDFSYCLTNDGSALATCSYASAVQNQNQVIENVVGTLPNTQNYFTYAYNQAVLPQLNSNSLIAPLLYTTTESTSSTSSSSPQSSNQGQGLLAQNQAQQAANFIRYATGSVIPLPLANRNQYDTLYQQAMNLEKTYTPLVQAQSQASLSSYIANLRVFAAQSSVGISNLYYILSKRLPQNQSTSSSGQQSSQALSEFTMATWRLYNPDQTPNTQWLAQINQASAATVQKEIASLLAEINYQLYLNRQQEERLLLTNTMLLLQNARASQPTINSSSPAASN